MPLYKKGDTESIRNNRGISLLCTPYAEILRIKLEEEVGKKNIIPEMQTEKLVKKNWSTMDNIFVLNHLIQKNKQTEVRERKIYALFADLKTAFE